MVYLVIAIFLLCLVIIYDLNKVVIGRSLMYGIVLLCFILLSGLRYRIGSDTLVYMSEFEKCLPLDSVGFSYFFSFPGRQPGWVFFLSLLKFFSNSFYIVQLIHAIFVNCIIISFIKKSTTYVFSAILTYFVILYPTLNFEVMRESIAICIFLIGTTYYKRKAWLQYYLVAFTALLFHESAVVALILPLFKGIRIDKKLIISFLIIVPVIFIFKDRTQLFLLDFFTFNDSLSNKASFYLGSDEANAFQVSMLINIFVSLILPLFILYRSSQKKENYYYDKIVLVALLIYGVSLVIPIFYRFNNYLSIFVILVFFRFFDRISKMISTRSHGLAFIICFLAFLFIKSRIYLTEIYNNTPSYIRYYPYYSVFSEDTDPQREAFFKTY